MQLLQQKLLWLSVWCIYIINTSRYSFLSKFTFIYGLPWWLSGKESANQARKLGLIPGPGRSLEEGNGNPLQCSCLGNPTERSLVGISPWDCKESDATLWLNNNSNIAKFSSTLLRILGINFRWLAISKQVYFHWRNSLFYSRYIESVVFF